MPNAFSITLLALDNLQSNMRCESVIFLKGSGFMSQVFNAIASAPTKSTALAYHLQIEVQVEVVLLDSSPDTPSVPCH